MDSRGQPFAPSLPEVFSGTPRFEVKRELGAGGFGTVYQVFDREHSQVVALKHLHRSDPVALRRFKQEFRSLANLAHSHLVSLYELHQDEAHWFFTMEFVEGSTFADYLRPNAPVPAEARGSSLALTRPGRPGRHQVLEHYAASAHLVTGKTIDADPHVFADTTPSDVLALLPGLPGIASPAAPLGPMAPARSRSSDMAPTALQRPEAQPGRPQGAAPSAGGQRRRTGGPTPLDIAQPFFGIEIPDEATMALWESTRPHFGGHGGIDRDRVRFAFRQLVEALAWLHASGHLHRDVKPSNVLVTHQGIVKVLDFGLVTRLFSADPHMSDPLVGTPAYMAPELCAGLPASPASDWYSVGVMLYLVLTGQLPFSGEVNAMVLAKQALEPRPPGELTAVPKDLEALCLALLARNPIERPDGMSMLEALGEKRVRVAPWGRGATSGFVGRRLEVARLAGLVSGRERAHDVALIHGLSGLGKTSLVEHVLRAVTDHDDSLVLRSRCFERGSVRYRALDGAVDDLAQWLSSLPSYELDAILPSEPGDRYALGRLFPAIPDLDQRHVPGRDDAARPDAAASAAVDPTELKRRAFLALRNLVLASAKKKVASRSDRDSRAPGIVIAIDDAQWADEDSLQPLAELLRGLPAGLVRWVFAYRADEADTSPFLKAVRDHVLPLLAGRVDSIALGPLDEQEALALATERLAVDSPEQARAIAAEAEGNPLLITELSRLSERNDRHEDATTSRRTGIADLLAARVLDLPVQARVALELVAVAAEPVPVRLIRAATGADQRDLNRLVQDHLIAARAGPAGELIMTWHDRVRETVAWRLSRPERARRHQTLAETAEAHGGADDLFLHTHWREAGVPEKARDYGIKAAQAAARAFAFDRAAEIYRSIIALFAGEPTHYRALGDALRDAGRGVQAARAYLEAAERTRDGAEVRRLEVLAAEQFLFAGAFGEGEAAIRKVLGRVGLSVAQGVPGAMASFAWETLRNRLRGLEFTPRDASRVPAEELAMIDTLWSGTIGLSMAQPLASQAFQQRHLRAALQAGEPFRVMRALCIELAFSGLPGGNDEKKSQMLSRRAHAVAGMLTDPYGEAFVTMSDGATHWLRGRWPEAGAAMERALAVFDSACTGVTWERDTARFVALSALAHQGQLGELVRRYEIALLDAVERGDLYLEVQLRTRFGPLLDLMNDRPEAARVGIHRALGRWTAAGYQIVHYWGFLNRVSSLLYEGDGRAAWREVLAGTPPLKRSFMLMGQYYRVQFQALTAKAALAALATASASEAPYLRQRAQAAAESLAKEDMGWSRPKAALFRGVLAGPSGEAPRRFAEAVAGFAQVSMHGHRLAAEALRARAAGDGLALRAADAALSAEGVLTPDRFRRIYTGI